MKKVPASTRDDEWEPMLWRTIKPIPELKIGPDEVVALDGFLRRAWTARRVVCRGSRQVQQLLVAGLAGAVEHMLPPEALIAPRYPGKPLSRAVLRQAADRYGRGARRQKLREAPARRAIGLVR